MKKIFSLWFTGISGSGKSTLAIALKEELDKLSIKTQIIDGDETRKAVGHLFGHTKEERMKMFSVNRLVAQYLKENDICTLVAVVAPFKEIRENLREYFGNAYIEVYVKCSYEECARRDTKGYYKMEKEGKIANLNGANDKYEIPARPDIVVDTEVENVHESVLKILSYLKEKQFI